MFDATKLLGAMLEHRSAPSAGDRLGNALGGGGFSGSGGSPLGRVLSQLGGGGSSPGAGGGGLGALLGGLAGPSRGGGAGAGGGLGGLLGALTGGAGGGRGGGAGAGPAGAAGMMGGFADMLHRAANAPGQELGRNNPVAVGGLGALAGTLLGGGRGAVGGGLLAVLGSLAYSALQAGGQGGAAAAAAHETPEEVQHSATLALKAMIQAAKADGQLDAREIERITGKLHEAGEDHEARDFVLREMGGPVDVEGLAAAARNPKEAAEIYAASLMAIEVDTQAERDYLARLAAALGLARPTVDHIHQSLGVAA
jgi:uncharacterized membrane protein YebE (DUF533 family)